MSLKEKLELRLLHVLEEYAIIPFPTLSFLSALNSLLFIHPEPCNLGLSPASGSGSHWCTFSGYNVSLSRRFQTPMGDAGLIPVQMTFPFSQK